jgi:nifR3 family TIM-barrel protein
MSGISNLPARLLAREAGAGLVFTETISARALVEDRPGALRKLASHPDEGRLAIQLFGGEAAFLGEATQRLVDRGVGWIDWNLGCPVKKFLRAGAGAALLAEPAKLPRLMRAMRHHMPGTLSVKMRLGPDAAHFVADEVAGMAAAEGFDLVSVHGRTRTQQYRGKADRDGIARVVAAVPQLPVLANGDIRSPEDVFSMLADTGAAGVMIGRAAVGNPWLFAQTLALGSGEQPEAPARRVRYATLERHVDWIQHSINDPAARTAQVRRYVAAYSKGMPGSSRFRERALCESDPATLLSMARVFFGERKAA